MVYAQIRICFKKCNAENSQELWDSNGPLNPGDKARPSVFYQEKRTCYLEDFAVLADHRVKMKESVLRSY